jgi:hypothetical protein
LAPDFGVEDLDHAFFAQIIQRLAELLGLGRIFQGNAAQDFWREIGQPGDTRIGALPLSVSPTRSVP